MMYQIIFAPVAVVLALLVGVSYAEIIPRGGVVHLGASRATLLSGGLNECLYAGDPTCSAGIQAVDAYARHLSNQSSVDPTKRQPFMVIPFVDTSSPFINMNQWGLGMNMFMNQFLSYRTFFAPTELLGQTLGFEQDILAGITDLQYEQFPLVYTNAAIPPANSWHEYSETVHFDLDTGLAVMYIASEDRELGQDAIESAKGTLTYVTRINANNYCGDANLTNANVLIQRGFLDNNETDLWSDRTRIQCFVPVMYFNDDKNTGLFPKFLEEIVNFEYPPALLIDVNGNAPEYKEPTRLGPDKFTWVVSQLLTPDNYFHYRIKPSSETLEIVDLDVLYRDLTQLPSQVADAEYKLGLNILAGLQNLTAIYNNVVGQSGTFPVASTEAGFRRCNAGECEIGNFFTDALRWHIKSDIAFLPSVLFGGDGWAAGDVQESFLYEALPQINYVCNGTMSGSSLFKLIQYSIKQASFEGIKSSSGGELLQVSGMKITYNTKLEGNRLVAIDVFNETTKKYKPLVPEALYTFATDSYACQSYSNFPQYTTKNLKADGERPGEFSFETNQLVAELYLSLLDLPYNPKLQGRLQNDTSLTQSLNLLQEEDDCVNLVTYWEPLLSVCLNCPAYSNVTWSNDTLELKGQAGSSEESVGTGVLVNNEPFAVKVTPKAESFPDFVDFSSMANGQKVDSASMVIHAGKNATIEYRVTPRSLEEGVRKVNLPFKIGSAGKQPGCVGPDIVFHLDMWVSPKEDLNQIGNLRYVGFVLFFVVFFTAIFFGFWVYRHAKLRVVTAMQPIFLYAICFGIIILAVTIVCLSIDDSLISPEGCSRNCVATYWFLSLGFCISVSALFSKLWRINKLFSQQQFRRVQVRERDVILPFAILFTLNFAFLLTWTVADPLRWVRIPVDGRPSNTYGICASSGPVGLSMMILIGFVDFTALGITCWQAYLARNINSDFSEAKYLGIGLFSWAQVALVGLPVLFLLDQDNPTARFFLLSALIFVVSISMMVIIFVPMILTTRQANAKGSSVRISGMGASSTKDSRSTGSNYSLGGGCGSVRISGLDSGSGASTYTTSQYKSAASSTASHFESIQEAPEAFEHDELDDEAKDAASNEEDCLVKEPDANEYSMDHDADDDEETRVLNATVDTADDVDSGATSSEASHELP